MGWITIPGVWVFVTGLVGLVMVFARTGPDEAASNLSKWIEKTGLHRVATRLRSPSVDRRVFRGAAIAMAMLLFIGGMGVGQWLNAAAPTLPVARPPKKPITFLTNPNFLQHYRPQSPLVLVGIAAKTFTSLRIAVEYTSSTVSRHRTFLGSKENVIAGTSLQFDLIVIDHGTSSSNYLWWGSADRDDPVPTTIVPNQTDERIVGRVVIIGPDDEEQYVPFYLLRLACECAGLDLIKLNIDPNWTREWSE
jgi:hypothetical protein